MPPRTPIAAPTRCAWAEGSDSLRLYHDTEWGVPLHDDRALFELLCLEGAQAGLSWRSVLDRREGYRAVYHGFAIDLVAAMTDAALEEILRAGPVIRNRLKVFSVRANARAAQAVIGSEGSFDAYLWSFVDGRTIVARSPAPPARTEASERMSRALRARGFRFVGATICYAFMQAAGLVDDHQPGCFRARD